MLMRQMELPLDESPMNYQGVSNRDWVCRALMLKPKLFCSMAFSAVDPLTRLELYEVVEKLISNEAVSIVMVRMISVRRSDWVWSCCKTE